MAHSESHPVGYRIADMLFAMYGRFLRDLFRGRIAGRVLAEACRGSIGGSLVFAVENDKETAYADSHFPVGGLAPKSVTTPIAMEVSNAVGGIPSLTAAVVIVVGLFGAICGFKVLQVGHVGSPIAQGLSMGTASHAVGTSRAMEISGKYGAYASLGLTLNGILTALLAPTILHLLGLY